MTTRSSNSADAPAAGPVVLWFEDFNAPSAAAPAEAPPPAPPITLVELEAAQREAWNEGYLAAGRAQEQAGLREVRRLLITLQAQLETLRQDLDREVGQNVQALARWLAGAFIAALPTLSDAAMESRIAVAAGVLRDVLRSMLHIEVTAGGRDVVSCTAVEEVWRAIERCRAEEPGLNNIDLTWSRGAARADLQRNWDQIRAALLPLAERTSGNPDDRYLTKQSTGPDHVG